MQLHQPPNTCINWQTPFYQRRLDCSQPSIMAILNITPDSFSDGGQYTTIDKALYAVEQMLIAGASIIDVGGESTRPNASQVTINEELERVVPVVRAIRQRFDCLISVDTSQPEVMAQTHSVGADIWNDVRALKVAGATEQAAILDIPVIMMHMRGEPSTMIQMTNYSDMLTEVQAELQHSINRARSAGVSADRIIIDPGFGFAKQDKHNLSLLNRLFELHQMGYPLLAGISRKRTLANILTKEGLPDSPEDRDSISAGAALLALMQGVSIVRVHNVAHTHAMTALWRHL